LFVIGEKGSVHFLVIESLGHPKLFQWSKILVVGQKLTGQKLTGEKLTEKLKNGQKLASGYVINEKLIN